jgi:molybdopterin-binding protein
MRFNLLQVTIAGVLPLFVLSLSAGSTHAQVGRPAEVAQASTEAGQGATGAAPAASAETQSVTGIVQSVTGDKVEMSLGSGVTESYTVPPEALKGMTLRDGMFVQLTADSKGNVQEVQPPEVEKVVNGVVSSIDGDQVTLQLPDGSTETTTVSPQTATQMNLANGSPIVVTTYKGTAATKICPGAVAAQPAPVAPPAPVPEPIAAPEPAPEPIRPAGGINPTPQAW